MDATEPSEAPAPRPQSAPIGQFDGPGVADHHVLYVAAPIRENSDLAPDLAADLGELASEFLAEEPIGRKPSAGRSKRSCCWAPTTISSGAANSGPAPASTTAKSSRDLRPFRRAG